MRSPLLKTESENSLANTHFIELFASIDEKNVTRFMSFLREDCFFRFGNLPAQKGQTEINAFVAGFFDSIAGVKHTISDIWIDRGNVSCHGMVSYTRLDQSVLTIPFATVFKTSHEKIYEYLIFADTSQLYTQNSDPGL